VGKAFVVTMEEQISPSQIPQQTGPTRGTITPEQLEFMKARAREAAVRTTLEQRQQQMVPPQVVYVRRNLTVAELILVVLLSCGLVTGVQVGWNFASKILPRIEIKVN
jgi:hypothetical protein